MALLKRNLWTLFLLTLTVGSAILALLLLSSWQSIVAEQKSLHSARVALVAQSMDSVLRTQELLLTVVGREILRAGDLPQSPQHSPELDRILQENPVAIGLGNGPCRRGVDAGEFESESGFAAKPVANQNLARQFSRSFGSRHHGFGAHLFYERHE